MKKLLTALVVIVSLGTTGAVRAQDSQKGGSAYDSGDYVTAVKEWRVLAGQGDAGAQFNLGVMYHDGKGVVQDYDSAVKWFRKAAGQGYAGAQNNLGVMYGDGKGVVQDNVHAHMWSSIAASNGHADAVKVRDILAKIMTAADISKAQGLARACVEKQFKGC